MACTRASRPKPAKLVTNGALRSGVERDLEKRYCPEQITGRLRQQFPDQPEMWVSTETIYQSRYVQSRGALRRDLAKYLRTGRALRRPSRAPGQRKNRIPEMVNVSQRAPQAADRAVPGHWEGELIIGEKNLQRHRDPPRAHHRLPDAGPTSPRATSPSRSATPSPRRSRRCPARYGPP